MGEALVDFYSSLSKTLRPSEECRSDLDNMIRIRGPVQFSECVGDCALPFLVEPKADGKRHESVVGFSGVEADSLLRKDKAEPWVAELLPRACAEERRLMG